MKRLWLYVSLAGALAATIWFWVRSQEPAAVTIASVESSKLDISFTSEAFVVGKTYDLAPQSTGRVVSVLANEGDPVAEGQPLVVLDSSQILSELRKAEAARDTALSAVSEAESAYRGALATARSACQVAEANIRRAEAELQRVQRGTRKEVLDQARHELERLRLVEAEAKRRFDRAQGLFEQDVISRAARDAARLEFEIAQAEVDRAEDALLELQRGPLPEEIEAARAGVAVANAQYRQAKDLDNNVQTALAQSRTARVRLREAEAQVSAVKTLLTQTTIESPVSGTLIRRFVEPGAVASPASVAVRIATREDLHIEAEIRSEDLGAVEPGAPVEISLPSQTGVTSKGVIERLSPAAEPKPDAAIRTRIVRARIRIVGDQAPFVPGIEVDVRGTRSEPAVLTVPNEALSVQGGRSTVWIVVEGRVELREVAMGRSTGDKTEILSGLRKGDQVVVIGKEGLRPGMQVKPTHESR